MDRLNKAVPDETGKHACLHPNLHEEQMEVDIKFPKLTTISETSMEVDIKFPKLPEISDNSLVIGMVVWIAFWLCICIIF